jgi:hypothetical protein
MTSLLTPTSNNLQRVLTRSSPRGPLEGQQVDIAAQCAAFASWRPPTICAATEVQQG